MYKLIKDNISEKINCVYRTSDGVFIPFSIDNTDYQEYLEWLAEGNTPLPAENT